MLKTANEHASTVDSYTKSHYDTLAKDFLYPADWESLRIIETFLEPFYQATLEAQTDKSTIDQVLLIMDALIQCLDEALHEYKDHKELSTRIQNAWEVFDKYIARPTIQLSMQLLSFYIQDVGSLTSEPTGSQNGNGLH